MAKKVIDVTYCRGDHCDEDRLKKTLNDIDNLCKTYPWLRELGRKYITGQGNAPGHGGKDMRFMSVAWT